MDTIKYHNGLIRYNGRTVDHDAVGARFFNWSGSGFEFSFIGTSVSAKFVTGNINEPVPNENERAYIGVFVDGSVYETARFPLDKNGGLYVLAEDLAVGTHTVRVVKETEMWYGKSGLVSLVCDGEFLPLSEKRKSMIEFIGDSITCGYGNLCSNRSPEFVTGEENFSNSYAAVTARDLGLSVSVIAASGNGFFHDYGCNTVNLIPELYEYSDKVFCSQIGVQPQKWDFSKDDCAAVVIKLGQNDRQYCSLADLPEDSRYESERKKRRKAFEETVYRFFERVCDLRPGVPILFICEDDMMLKPECLRAAQRTGRVGTLVFPSKKEYEGVGANGHYSVYTHARVARTLTDRLKEIL